MPAPRHLVTPDSTINHNDTRRSWDTPEEEQPPRPLSHGDTFDLTFRCAGTKWQPEELAQSFVKHDIYPLACTRFEWRNFNAHILATSIEGDQVIATCCLIDTRVERGLAHDDEEEDEEF